MADGVAFAQGRRGYQALSGEGGSAKQKKKEKKAKGEAVADKRRDKGSKKGKRDKREERADKKGRRKVMSQAKKIACRARGAWVSWVGAAGTGVHAKRLNCQRSRPQLKLSPFGLGSSSWWSGNAQNSVMIASLPCDRSRAWSSARAVCA